MSTGSPPKITKKQAILDDLAANPKSTHDDVVNALAKQGIEVKVTDVASAKYRAKKEKGEKKRAKRNAKSSDSQEAKARRRYLQRPYPQKTFEEALVLPQKIKEKNNGNPWAVTISRTPAGTRACA